MGSAMEEDNDETVRLEIALIKELLAAKDTQIQ
jgi:hypothetical protein